MEHIIHPGGEIFFSTQNNTAIGTVALIKRGDGIFELTKMAIAPSQQGKNTWPTALEILHWFCQRKQL